MNTKALRQKILDLAIHGKLVPQDPNDEPASVLLERIKAEKERLIKEGKIKRAKRSKAACDKPHYPYELPEGWAWCKLEDIAYDLMYGTSEKSLSEGLVPVLRMGNINRIGEIDWNNLVYTSNPTDISKYSLKHDDLLFNRTNSSEWVGKTAIYKGHRNVIYAGYIIRIRTISVNADYINYVMNSSYHRDWCNEVKTDAVNQSNINAQKLSQLYIPIPPYKEQQRIVNSVQRWVTLIDNIEKEKCNLTLSIEQTKSKILDLAIHGKLVPQDPTDEPAAELLKRIMSADRQVNPKAEIACDNAHYRNLQFQIPLTWAWCSHNDVLEISGGSQPAKRFFSSVPQKGYIRLYQIRDYGENPIPIYIPIEFATKQTESGDILLARYGGSLGKVFHAEKGAYNVAMAKVIFKYKDLINKEYAYFYYLSDLYQGRLKEISRTAQAGFNSSDFNEMYFPLPPYKEQQRIVNAIDKAFTTLDAIIENL